MRLTQQPSTPPCRRRSSCVWAVGGRKQNGEPPTTLRIARSAARRTPKAFAMGAGGGRGPPKGREARGRCTWPTKGLTASGNLGYPKQCTEGAFAQWRAYTGFWPSWSGNAAKWSTTAKTNGYTVTPVAMPKSVVVFPGTTSNPAGHGAWVDSISQSSSGAISLNVIEENYDGTATRPTGHIRRWTYAASSTYRYIPAP